MRMSKRGRIELACLEGVSTQIYYDTQGVRTIGIGATISEIPGINDWRLTDTITIQDAFELFATSLVKYEDAVNNAVTAPLTQPQFDALVSFCYNVGRGGMKKSTLVKDLNSGKPMSTIYADFMKWTANKELVGRRTKEAKLFTTGVYQTNGKALLYKTNGTGKIKGYSSVNLFDYIK